MVEELDKLSNTLKSPSDYLDFKFKIKFVNELNDQKDDLTKKKCNMIMQFMDLNVEKEDIIDLIYTCYKQNKFTPLWSLSISFLVTTGGTFDVFSYYGICSLHIGDKYKYPSYTLKYIIEWYEKCLKETGWISPKESFESLENVRKNFKNIKNKEKNFQEDKMKDLNID